MLQLRSLLFKFKIIVLEYLNQLLKVVRGFLVLKLDVLTFEAKVSRHICKLAQIRVFLQVLSHLVAERVVVVEQHVDFFFFGHAVLPHL